MKSPLLFFDPGLDKDLLEMKFYTKQGIERDHPNGLLPALGFYDL